MTQSAKRYMDRHRIVRTHDTDAATAFLQTKGYCLDVARRDATQLDMCINCAVLPGLSVGYLQNGILPSCAVSQSWWNTRSSSLFTSRWRSA